MSKIIRKAAAAVLALTLAGCSSSATASTGKADSGDDKVITIGATAVPHAEILDNVVKDLVKKDGYTLKVTVFNDYIQPNTAVEDRELDANYFETIRYLDEENEERNLHLKAVAGIHLEPMGIYSKKIKSLDDLADGATVAIPNDGSNESRALKLLADNGLIKLKDTDDLYVPSDVTDNPKNLKLSEQDAANLTRVLDDVDASVINGNYALEAKLNPAKDALAAEQADGEDAHYYINYLVVREGNENSAKTKELIKALQSDEVKDYIDKNYSGSVIPAFTDGDGNPIDK